MHEKGYDLGETDNGTHVNLIGIRSAALEPRTYNDWIAAAYCDGVRWNFFPFPATTDPGTFWQDEPRRVQGTSVLEPGQYPNLWRVGRLRGRRALRQRGPARVWRGARRQHYLDTEGVAEAVRQAGIDLFAAGEKDGSRWRSAAQVLQDREHARFLMALCARAAPLQDDSFTYTLLEEADFVL
jgi:hypothetical protein